MGSKRQHQNLAHSLDATTHSPPALSSQHRAPAFEFLFPSGEFDLVARAIGILPAGWRTQVLVDNFFNRAHWQHRVSITRHEQFSVNQSQLLTNLPLNSQTFNRLSYLRQVSLLLVRLQ